MVTIDELAARKQLPTSVLRRFGVVKHGDALEFEYRNGDGAAGKSRLRTALKGAGGSSWPERDDRVVCEYANAVALLPPASEAWVVEGESDCWVLYSHGRVGIGVPGADCIDCLDGARLNRFSCLYLVVENIEAPANATFPSGPASFVQQVSQRLRRTGFIGQMHVCKPPNGYQDLSDVHTGTLEFDQAINEMKTNATSL